MVTNKISTIKILVKLIRPNTYVNSYILEAFPTILMMKLITQTIPIASSIALIFSLNLILLVFRNKKRWVNC